MGQWLALRNLGLVPVASPETFQWPGHFLGLRRDSSSWAVFFGIPPGIVYDPMAEPDGKIDATMDATFVLAKHDPQRGTELSLVTESVGMVELIALAAEAEGPPCGRYPQRRLLRDVACWATATSVELAPSRARADAATISPWWRPKR